MSFLLSSQNVLQYLLDSNFNSATDLSPNQIELKFAKNFNLLLTFSENHQLLVKQERFSAEGKTVGEFSIEWQIKQFVDKFLELHSLRSLLPEILYFDAENSILVFRFLRNYRDLIDFYVKEKHFPTEIAAVLGRAIAQIHGTTFEHQEYREYFNVESTSTPIEHFAYRIGRVTPETFGVVPADAIKFFALYQRYDSLGQAIAALMQTYQPCCLLHNDFKLNNVLVHLQWENTSESPLRLIDWERATWGDPAFDLGTVIASYLQLWLNSLVVSKDMAIEESLRLAMTPLDRLQASIAALIQSYLQEFPEILDRDPNYLKRVVQFAGLALIQQIHAGIQYQKSFGNAGICMLQVAKSLLCRPESSIPTVFGLSEAELLQKTSANVAKKLS